MDITIFNETEYFESDNWIDGPVNSTIHENSVNMADPYEFINNFVVDNEVIIKELYFIFFSFPH